MAGASIGNLAGALHRSDLNIDVTGPVTLVGNVSGARIGHATGYGNPGTVNLRSGSVLQVGNGSVIRATESVSVSAGSLALVPVAGASGGIVGQTVTVSAGQGILIGASGGVQAAG